MDTFSLLFSPVCLNVVFLFLPRNLTAASFHSLCSHKRSWQNHIPSSRSFRCNRLSGNKKAGTQMRTDFPQKDRLIPAVVASHSCNRLWNSKSKLSFTLCLLPTVQDSLEAAAFSLAYRRHCPAYCRSLNQFVKIDIPLWWQINYQFYYIEQMFACQDCSPFSIELSCEFHRTVLS